MIKLLHGECNICLACQNRCVSCNHFVPLQSPFMVDPDAFKRDLEMAARVMHFDVFNLVGGEPTLHPRVVDLLRMVKAAGIADRREITSNGQSCKRWPDELYQELDDLIITPYKLLPDERELITSKSERYNVRLEWHWVGFTYAAYRKGDSRRGDMLYRDCWYAANRNVIDNGYFYRCCIGRFIPQLLLGLPREDDAIALDGLTEERLRAFLSRRETPSGCNVCGSNRAPSCGWSEQPDREKWLAESLA